MSNLSKPTGPKGTPGKKKKTNYLEIRPLWIGLFIDILGFYIIIPFLPTFIELFQTTPFIIGLVLATNAVFTMVFAPIWGRISDKIGRKPVLIISQMGTCTAFIMLAFSNSVELLIIARVVDGIFGGNFPMVKAIVTDVVPPKDRGLQMTNVGVVHTLAGLVGPGLGGFLSIFQPLGPEYPIVITSLVAAALSFTTIMITTFFVKESYPKTQREIVHKEVKVKMNLLQNKDASWLLTLYAFHTFSFTMYVTTLTIYIGLILGMDTLGVSILLTISGASRAIVRFTVFNYTKEKLGEKNMTIMGLFILVITFFFVGFVTDVITFIILMIFVSYGVSCSRGLIISKITQTVSPKEMGKINGYSTTLDSLAQIFGPIMGTFLLDTTDAYWWGILMSMLSLAAFLMVFRNIIPYMEKMKQSQPPILENP